MGTGQADLELENCCFVGCFSTGLVGLFRSLGGGSLAEGWPDLTGKQDLWGWCQGRSTRLDEDQLSTRSGALAQLAPAQQTAVPMVSRWGWSSTLTDSKWVRRWAVSWAVGPSGHGGYRGGSLFLTV